MVCGWKNLFKPWILERGRGYFLNGLVSDLDISDGEITACVEGNEEYRVEIQMTDGIPDEMWCDCPYADSGENCKHNKACEWVKGFADLFMPGDLLQKRILPRLNDNLAPRGTHSFAHEVLLGMLRDRYGEDIQSCRMAELDVELALHTPCRRVIRVPADLNMYQLHRVLQGIFEWHNCHLHQFVTKRDRYGRPTEVLTPGNEQDEWEDLYDGERLDSTAVTVEELFSIYRQVDYEYDFGDDWQHTIRLQRFIEDCSQVQPHCILAVGDAPMEDCGGASGFEEVRAILDDPNHPEHREYVAWVRGTWWQPLDVERINRRVRDVCRRSIPSAYELENIW